MGGDEEKGDWPSCSSQSKEDDEERSMGMEREEDHDVVDDVIGEPFEITTTHDPDDAPPALEAAQTKTMVVFRPGDPTNPYNWPTSAKMYALCTAIVTVMNSTIGSSLAFAIVEPLAREWGITNQAQQVLPTSMYLIGYVVGPVIFGPTSEHYGRQYVMAIAFFLYTMFTLGCALANNFTALVIFRLIAGAGASCPIAVVGGICADVFGNPRSRGRAMAFFMAATTFGPCMGPVISGYTTPTSWRWAFWAGLIITAPGWLMLAFMRETYGPVLLKRRAVKLRKETGNQLIVAPAELEKRTIGHVITVVVTRPIRMIIFEWLVLFTCIYLSLVYGIFYIFLESFPLIFGEIYGFTVGEQGLAFLPIGVGAIFAGVMYYSWDKILDNARAKNAKWSRSEESRRLPLACAGGPFIVIAMFWAGWTARENIHWIVPVLSGISFGIGYLLIFMALLNYLVDAYEVFAASAMAAASMSRSLIGAVLPFAAKPMYDTLGIAWASSLLGFLALIMCAVPFGFIVWGNKLRENSAFCQRLKELKVQQEAQIERQLEKDRKLAAAQEMVREGQTDLEKQAKEQF